MSPGVVGRSAGFSAAFDVSVEMLLVVADRESTHARMSISIFSESGVLVSVGHLKSITGCGRKYLCQTHGPIAASPAAARAARTLPMTNATGSCCPLMTCTIAPKISESKRPDPPQGGLFSPPRHHTGVATSESLQEARRRTSLVLHCHNWRRSAPR